MTFSDISYLQLSVNGAYNMVSGNSKISDLRGRECMYTMEVEKPFLTVPEKI
jgi:hypothetical protein